MGDDFACKLDEYRLSGDFERPFFEGLVACGWRRCQAVPHHTFAKRWAVNAFADLASGRNSCSPGDARWRYLREVFAKGEEAVRAELCAHALETGWLGTFRFDAEGRLV